MAFSHYVLWQVVRPPAIAWYFGFWCEWSTHGWSQRFCLALRAAITGVIIRLRAPSEMDCISAGGRFAPTARMPPSDSSGGVCNSIVQTVRFLTQYYKWCVSTTASSSKCLWHLWHASSFVGTYTFYYCYGVTHCSRSIMSSCIVHKIVVQFAPELHEKMHSRCKVHCCILLCVTGADTAHVR